MGNHFREALATISRALPPVIFRAGVFVAGGFGVIVLCGMLLFIFRPASGIDPVFALILVVPVLVGGGASAWLLQRFFLYRQQAAMLFLFSGGKPASPGLAGSLQEGGRVFTDHFRWAALNRKVRLALFAFYRGGEESFAASGCRPGRNFPRIPDLLALGPVSHGILALAVSRGDRDIEHATREALALYFRLGSERRLLARRWLWFSSAGMAFLFLCLALPNWFFFASAGAPVWIGMALAAAIAWLLHRAFVAPFVLAGICGTLLAETRGKTPDPDLLKKLDPLALAAASPNGPTK
jgi:hypothetical protein